MVYDLLDFTKLLVEFNQIQRDLYLNYLGRNENDSEHSFQLAITAWFIYEQHHLDLDLRKILAYSLIHDLVEVYAGDTPVYTKNIFLKATKKIREKNALNKLIKNYQNNNILVKSLHDYYYQIDEEGKFIKALDKLLPILNIYLDGGHAWKTHNIDMQLLYKKVYKKVKDSPIIEGYFQDLMKLLDEQDVFDDIF